MKLRAIRARDFVEAPCADIGGAASAVKPAFNLRWGECSADEQHAGPVVVAVFEAAGDASVEFDESVESPMFVKLG